MNQLTLKGSSNLIPDASKIPKSAEPVRSRFKKRVIEMGDHVNEDMKNYHKRNEIAKVQLEREKTLKKAEFEAQQRAKAGNATMQQMDIAEEKALGIRF